MSRKQALTRALVACAGFAALVPAGASAATSVGSPTASTSTTATQLRAMPAGKLTVTRGAAMMQLHLHAYGLTPGSTHRIQLAGASCARLHGRSHGSVSIGDVQANGGGALSTSLDASAAAAGSRQSLLVLLGAGVAGSSAAQPVACAPLPGRNGTTALHQLAIASGHSAAPTGKAELAYDSATKSLQVHVIASGFAPHSLHAAHIHQGSCTSQGSVVYMLRDLRAHGNGDINAWRAIDGVDSPPPASTWYLNIHLGDSQTILSGGQPTQQFQPLLCGDIAGSMTSMGSAGHGRVATSDGEMFLSPGQTGRTVLKVGPFTFTADCTTVQASGQSYNQAAFNVVSSENNSDLDGGGPVPAGQAVNIHTDSDLTPNPQGASPPTPPLMNGAFDQTPSASTSTEIAPDGTEVDLFYNDGVNLDGHACFAGAVATTS